MELFDIVFNSQNIYETIFFNIKSVTSHKTVFDLREEKPELFEQWKLIASVKYDINQSASVPEDAYELMLNDAYKSKGMFYPEFSKIVGIMAATIDDNLKRKFHDFIDVDEVNILRGFRQYLIDSCSAKMPTLCGHNVINNDIPLLIKRLFYHRNNIDTAGSNLLPQILKNHLKAKPWEANIIDTINLWKFNGVSNTPLPLIADFVGLKTKTELLQMDDLSHYYWNNIVEKSDETLKFIGSQAANQVNLILMLLRELRKL